MSCSSSIRSVRAALRPWPFGPPLRGRAPRGTARARAAHRLATPSHSAPASVGPSRQATAPVGGLAGGHSVCCVL